MSKKNVNVGIVGYGKHMKKCLLPSLQQIDTVNLYGVCNRTEGSSKAFIDRFGGRIYSNIHEMVNDANINCMVVSVNHRVHEEAIKASIAAGKPCFVEKPLTLDPDFIHSLNELDWSNNARVCVGYNFRHSTCFEKVKEICIANGGAKHVDITFESSGPKDTRGTYSNITETMLFEMGTHVFDLLYELIGFLSVDYARVTSVGNKETILSELIGHSGQHARVMLRNSSNKFNFIIQIQTDNGTIIDVHNLHRIELRNYGPVKEAMSELDLNPSLYYEWPLRRNGFDKNGYLRLLKSFIEFKSGNGKKDLERELNIAKVISAVINISNY